MNTYIKELSLNDEIFNARGRLGNPAHHLSQNPTFLCMFLSLRLTQFCVCQIRVLQLECTAKFLLKPLLMWNPCPVFLMDTLRSLLSLAPLSALSGLLFILPSWASLPARNAFSHLRSDFSTNDFVVFQRLRFICFL